MRQPIDHLQVVAIFFWGRSGSVFLHSLFDSHPQVLTLPATRLNAFHGRQWEEIQHEPSAERMVQRFCSWNPSLFDGHEDRWFEGLDRMGDDKSQALCVDPARFAHELVARLAHESVITRKNFFLHAHLAYALARGEDISQKTTVIYHMHSPEAYAAIGNALCDFPNLRGLGVTREPIRSALSYLRKNVLAARAWQQADRSEYHQLASTGAYNFVYRHQLTGWRELCARHPLPLRPVRIEDLNRDTEGEMRRLAAELGLDWHPCLTQSTFNGLAYWGDQLAIGASNPNAAQAPKSEEAERALDRLDRYVLEGLLAAFRHEFGYGETRRLQRALVPLLVLVPTRLERLDFIESLSRLRLGPARSSALERLLATARRMLERQAFSYRHLLCEGLPTLRTRFELPRPLSPGLVLPAKGLAHQAACASQTRVV